MSVTLKITDWKGDEDLAMAQMYDIPLQGPDLPPSISYMNFDSETDADDYVNDVENSKWNTHYYDGVDSLRCHTDYKII